MRVLIDGMEVPDGRAAISVFDWGLQRGFGCFEVVRSYDGVPFRTGSHLDRLQASAAALAMPLPPIAAIEEWVRKVSRAGGDCQIRVMVTAGGRDPLFAAPPRTIVLWEPLPSLPSPVRLLPMESPWHPATNRSPLSGVKWLSYAPNMASADIAKRAGYDGALLVTPAGVVLEGHTFCVAWLAGGRIETPSLDLGILASITRAVLFEVAGRLGLSVDEGAYPLDRMLEADEAVVLSTVQEILPIGVIGDRRMPAGDQWSRLAAAYKALAAEETG
jgi:branched-subunit amino acid aminotransferase/4-amino-4-deoxychorismate lyase